MNNMSLFSCQVRAKKNKKKIGKLTQHQTVYSSMVQTAICKITT